MRTPQFKQKTGVSDMSENETKLGEHHLERELEPEAIVIAKEYLNAIKKGNFLPYNPEYVIMRLMVDLHGYVPPEPIAILMKPWPFAELAMLANDSE